METSEFQIESLLAKSIKREPWKTGSDSNYKTIDNCALTRLVLKIALTGKAGSSDHEFFNQLVLHDGLQNFMAIGNKFVYPEDKPLFPLEEISGAISQASTAHFQHHVSLSAKGSDRQLWKVQSAVVDEYQDEPVLLGLMTPRATVLDPMEHSRFGELILEYRKIRADLAPVISRIEQYLGSDSACLVINDEGRVLVANKSAGTLLRQKPDDLSGKLFESVEPALKAALPDHRLSMRRISQREPGLSLVMLNPIKPAPLSDDLFAAEFFAYNMKQKLSNITAAASFLLDGEGRSRPDEDIALIDLIQEQSLVANQLLSYMTLLLDYNRLNCHQVDMVTALEEAKENCHIKGDLSLYITKSPQVFAPRKAIVTLFEAVLKAHGSDSTSVAIRQSEIPGETMFEFVTNFQTNEENFTGDATWMDFARRLAIRTGVEIVSTMSNDKSQLKTEIRIKHD